MKSSNPTIGIIGGSGKMGQWFTHFFQTNNLKVLNASRNSKLTVLELTKQSDIVIVSVPISKTQDVLKEIIPHLGKNKLLSDITSFKVMPMEIMKTALCGTLGMHPLFGPTANIGQALKIVFCKQRNNEYVSFLENIFIKNSIEIIELSAEEHDYQMAYIQALTHAVNLLFAKTIFEQKNMLENKLLTPTFALQALVMGRVLHQDLELISDIQLYNPYFLTVLEAFVEQAKKLVAIIEDGDGEEFSKMFSEEKKIVRDFSHYSIFQSDNMLAQLSEIKPPIPEKKSTMQSVKPGKTVYLGPPGTYSHEVALKLFAKSSFEKISMDSIFSIFNSVTNGDVSYGVIPAENSIEGTVRGTLDYLVDFPVSIVGSFDLAIHHQLLSSEKKLEDIRIVASHPQALAQCKAFLEKNLPLAKLLSAESTTSQLGKKQKETAYISSEGASKRYNIPILKRDIEDNSSNTTKFYVIAKKAVKINGVQNNRTLLFLTVYNRVGILRDILDVFAKHNLNLTKLESRPSQQKLWDYHFFVEVDKENEDPDLLQSLKELQTFCPVIRILGST